MKTNRIKTILFTLALLLAIPLTACSKKQNSEPEPEPTPKPEPVYFDSLATDKKRCYSEDVTNKTITFLFDSALWRKGNPKSIEVRGSFNDWGDETKYVLQKCDTAVHHPFWFITLPYSAVKFPGNSGQPEFKFVTNGSTWQEPPSWLTSGYKFNGTSNNQIIVYSTDDLEQIKAKNKIAGTKKKLSDFDLNTQQGREDISNVRIVPGTKCLMRCYHPFKYTTSSRNSTEFERVKQVKMFFEEYGIKTDICLSKDQTKDLVTVTIDGKSQKEEISAYYQNLIDNDKVAYIGYPDSETDYYDCYHDPRSAKVGGWVGQVIDAIVDDSHDVPISIHCRIGTDRTGFFCALIGVMCGATFDEVTADYQRSNNMYIKEYRDANMMKVAFEGLLQVEDVKEVLDLKSAVTNYFITNGYTTQAKVDKMIEKLNTPLK
ncbi:MAG: tyrosine-protein phosphatase [Paludibacteraceae bacterium]|nr:tyrosine-protein phosphatase [Paludibacteraceae bacterium]